MSAAAAGGRIFYGWAVVLATFAVTLAGFGAAYSFSAFMEPLQREFGASRGSVSLVFSLAGFLYFSLGVVSGPLADRWGARRLAFLGMLLVAAGLALAGAARSLAEVYAAYGLGVGLGVGLAYVPAIGAVQHWFVRRRGFASGVAVSGIGVGTLIAPPLASWLIGNWGWRSSYMALAALVAIVGAGMALLIESDPHARGTGPDGDAVEAGAPAPERSGASLGEAVRSPRFIGLYIASMVCAFGVFVPFVHLIPYALDRGIVAPSAALLLGAIGVGSTAGRFLLGGVADFTGRMAFLAMMFAGMGAALAAWPAATGYWGLALFALAFGAFYGGWVAIMPAVAMDLFGGRNVAGVIGVLYTSVGFGTLIGPTAAGFIHDASQSYTIPILASAAANVVAACIVGLMMRAEARGPAPDPGKRGGAAPL